MKKALLILSVFLTQFNLFLVAQTIEINDQSHQFVEFNNVLSLGNERWLLAGSGDSGNGNEMYLMAVDSSTEVSTFYTSNSSQTRVIEKVDVQGNLGYALTTIDNQRYISKFSINSNSISFKFHQSTTSDESFNNLKILPNGNVVAVGYKIVDNQAKAFFKVIKSNSAIDFSDYFMFGYFSDVVVFPDTSFILTGSFGDNQTFGGKKFNKYYEQQGDILEGIESDRIFPLENNGYFLFNNQTITKLDNDFQIGNSVDFGSYGFIIDMAVDDENVFLLYQKVGEPPMVLRLNHSLEVENSFFVEDENFRAKSVDVSESELGIGGYLIPTVPFNNTSHLYPSTSGFFKTFSKEGMSGEEDFDLEIFEVTVEDHEKEFPCGAPEMTSSYRLNLKNIKVALVNNGSETINNVDLFMEVLGLKLCVTGIPTPQYYLQKEEFSLLRLDPGDTLRWRLSAIEFPQRIEDTASVNICVWHTTVEDKRDLNPDNDYFCGEVTLKTGYVETPIIEPTTEEYLFFPNPINQKLTVSLLRAPFEPTELKFYDYMGRELDLKYFIAARAKYKEFDVSQLPSGFYFMKISNDLFEDMVRVYVN